MVRKIAAPPLGMHRRFTMRFPARAKLSSWFRPYVNNGKPHPGIPQAPGLYVIKTRAGRYSLSNLRKTMLRHFQSWRENNHHHATYPAGKGMLVRFMTGIPVNRIHDYERSLIKRIKPRDNHLRYSGSTWQGPPPAQIDINLLLGGREDDLPF